MKRQKPTIEYLDGAALLVGFDASYRWGWRIYFFKWVVTFYYPQTETNDYVKFTVFDYLIRNAKEKLE